jgi:hypothetical protein
VYKAVLVTLRQADERGNEAILSVAAPYPHGIEYVTHKTMLPEVPGSFLYAFSDQQVAQKYIGTHKDSILSQDCVLRVYTAEADVVTEYPQYQHRGCRERFGRGRWDFGIIALRGYCIPGTVWCRSISCWRFCTRWARPKVKVKPQQKQQGVVDPTCANQIFDGASCTTCHRLPFDVVFGNREIV